MPPVNVNVYVIPNFVHSQIVNTFSYTQGPLMKISVQQASKEILPTSTPQEIKFVTALMLWLNPIQVETDNEKGAKSTGLSTCKFKTSPHNP